MRGYGLTARVLFLFPCLLPLLHMIFRVIPVQTRPPQMFEAILPEH
jgi:hypothetical protein